jgi:lipoic acid synthetase
MSAATVSSLPAWFKQRLPDDSAAGMSQLLREFSLHTVCEEALCPNRSDCFRRKEVTFLLLGKICTRNCAFCRVEKNYPSLNCLAGDFRQDINNITRIVRVLKPGYVVLTSVTRDDLADGGAAVFAQCVRAIRRLDKDIKIEVLIPDFQGRASALKAVAESAPWVIGHNIETVPRLYPNLRPQADYARSLTLLAQAKDFRPGVLTKSSLMLGLGEKEVEVIEAMRDLRRHGCDILVLGQYLAPSLRHYPVEEYLSPERFQEYQRVACLLGFKAVLSAPLARSSYRAAELYREASGCTI